MQHKIFTAFFLTVCAQLSASQKIHAPQQKAEQEIAESLDEEIVSEAKITLRNLYNEVIDVPRSWLQQSKMLATALETDPEETEIKLPCIKNTGSLDDVYRALMILDQLSANSCIKKAHEIMLKLDTMEKSDASVEIIKKDFSELCRLPGVGEEFEDSLTSIHLNPPIFEMAEQEQTFSVYDIRLQNFKEIKKVLRVLGLKQINDVFKFSQMDNARLLELYASAQYLDIPIVLEYINPIVAGVVLENYFDSECNYIIRNFDSAWEEEMANLVREEFKEYITTAREKLTPERKLYGHTGEIAVFWQESSRISSSFHVSTISPYILYSGDSHSNKKLWDKGICIWSTDQYASYQPYEYGWTPDNTQLAAASGITGNKYIKIWRFDFNLTIEQMAFIKKILTAQNRKIAIEQHENLFQSLPECWKSALEPEKKQRIPIEKWCAQFYSMAPIARYTVYGLNIFALTGAWLLWKFKKRA